MKAAFPKIIKRDSLALKIYKTRSHGATQYTLAFRQDGERKYISSRNLAALEARAAEVLEDLAGGRPAESNALTAHEREEFSIIKAFAAEAKVPALTAMRHFSEAVRLLGSDLIIESARAYVARNMQKAAALTVKQVADEMIAAKRARGRSDLTLKDLSYRLGAFAESCRNTKIGDLRQGTIQAFLDGLGLSPRSYNNFRLTVLAMFKYAIARKYLPRDWDEMSSIEKAEGGDADITVYSAAEIETLLAAARSKELYAPLIPFLALGAFAGLRSAEICRLTWDAVNEATGHITLAGKVKDENGKVTRMTKTGARRVIPILPALKSWLALVPRTDGRVFDYGYTYQYDLIAQLCAEKICADGGVKWKANALRHSFITYRLADTGDMNRTALEAGNSPQMVSKHYNALATPEQGKAWFSIRPAKAKGKGAKVIQLKKAA